MARIIDQPQITATDATTLIIDASLGGSVYDWLAIARTVECVEVRGVCGFADFATRGIDFANMAMKGL